MIFLIKLMTIFVLSALIIVGSVYITIYEQAPLWERCQVFLVGFGMYVGLLSLLC